MKQKNSRNLFHPLAAALVLALLAGCSGQPREQVSDKTAGSSASASEVEQGGWYELNDELGVLTVRIPDETPGFHWDFLIKDDSVLELLTQETTEGIWAASFRALDDGESQIIFSYVQNDAVNEARLLEFRCADGKVAEVTLDSVIDMSGELVDDPESVNP